MKNANLFEHIEEYGESRAVSSRVPCVLSLFGFFADCCNGNSLCCALDRGIDVTVSERSDSLVKVYNSKQKERKHFYLSGLRFRKEDRLANPIKGVINYLSSSFEIKNGFDVTISGDGLNSTEEMRTTAVAVGFLVCLCSVLKIELSQQEKDNCIRSTCQTFCDIRFSFAVMKTMLYAKEGFMMAFDLDTGAYSYIPDVFKGSDTGLYIVDSNIPSSMINEEVSRCLKESDSAFAKFRKAFKTGFSGADKSVLYDRSVYLSEDDRRLCLFLFEDSRLARVARKAFEQGNSQKVAAAIRELRLIYSDVLEFSCPEIDWVMKRLSESMGCLGSGFGFYGSYPVAVAGMTVNMVDVCMEKMTEYEHIFGFSLTVSEVVLGCGAKISDNGFSNEVVTDK